jgi:predicted RNase H-like HicB family nuclease
VAETHVLTAVLTPDPDGGYVTQIAELPGAISHGDTVAEALANVRAAAGFYLEDATAVGESVARERRHSIRADTALMIMETARTATVSHSSDPSP